MNSEKEIQRLPVKLTEEELRTAGYELAVKWHEARNLEDQKKAVAKDFQGRIEGLHGEAARLSAMVETGVEHRQVECEKRFDDEAGTVTIVRLDTAEELSVRPMTAAERQMGLKIDFKKPKAVEKPREK